MHPDCESVLKPGGYHLGGSASKRIGAAIELSSSCDLMFIVGTSLNLQSNTIPSAFLNITNAVLVEVNPEETWLQVGLWIFPKEIICKMFAEIFYDLME